MLSNAEFQLPPPVIVETAAPKQQQYQRMPSPENQVKTSADSKSLNRSPLLRALYDAVVRPQSPQPRRRMTNADPQLESILSQKSDAERRFFELLDEQLSKINAFYTERESEAIMRLEQLRDQLAIYRDSIARGASEDFIAPPSTSPKRQSASNSNGNKNDLFNTAVPKYTRKSKSDKGARSRLKDALLEYYRLLELLKNFRILNYTGIVKILKKFDKTAQWQSSSLYLRKVDVAYFRRSKIVDSLLVDTEDLFLSLFPNGKRKEAKQ